MGTHGLAECISQSGKEAGPDAGSAEPLAPALRTMSWWILEFDSKDESQPQLIGKSTWNPRRTVNPTNLGFLRVLEMCWDVLGFLLISRRVFWNVSISCDLLCAGPDSKIQPGTNGKL